MSEKFEFTAAQKASIDKELKKMFETWAYCDKHGHIETHTYGSEFRGRCQTHFHCKRCGRSDSRSMTSEEYRRWREMMTRH